MLLDGNSPRHLALAIKANTVIQELLDEAKAQEFEQLVYFLSATQMMLEEKIAEQKETARRDHDQR